MSTKSLSIYQLLNGILDQGLPMVASYMEKRGGRPVIIIDNIGFVHYPASKENSTPLEKMFIDVPSDLKEDDFYYGEEEGSLCYAIGQNEARAYVIVKNLTPDMLPNFTSLIGEAKLALKTYFSNIVKVRKNTEQFEKTFAEDLFYKSHANIRDIINLSEKGLDINNPYFIKMAQVDEAPPGLDLRLIRSYSLLYCKQVNLDVIPISWGKYILFIIPALFKEDTLEIDPEWPRLADSVKWKEDLERKFNCVISGGLGECYMLQDLHKSYYEARIAMTLPKLMGQTGFMQKFSDLGAFSLIFSQDSEVLKSYCLRTLDKLIKDEELLQTMRTLLDNAYNWKLTANDLFVHVNTLHYRVNKIEQLLNIDLAKSDARANLYIAIKVWDTLRMNGFLD